MSIHSPIRAKHQGFTLLEVLIALVILGFGFLGAGKLLLTSVKANDSAYLRTVATELGYSILESMRANRAAALAGNYTYNWGSTNPTTSLAYSNGCYAVASPQTASAIALCDMQQWKYQLSVRLPSGDGAVIVTGNYVTIKVFWDDSRAQCAMTSQGSCSYSISSPGPNFSSIVLASVLQ